jgi:predicted Rossmann-fold nucleotide-binding protein
MECANKGAREAGGKSCGLCINLPNEAQPNPYIDEKYHLSFRYFFVRKGGFGTLDELFEALTLIQTGKIKFFPVYLVGRTYWAPLIDWIKNTLLAAGNIKREDFDLIHISDDLDAIVDGIEKHYRHTKSLENF